MAFRVATLNLKRNETRWDERREALIEQLAEIKPDILTLNEVWLPSETGRCLQAAAQRRCNLNFALVQQPKTAESPQVEAEAILTRGQVIERAHRYYLPQGGVIVLARVKIAGRPVDIYVTHLYNYRHPDAERAAQVRQLLDWTSTRNDAAAKIVCGDFNAGLDNASIQSMTANFRATQLGPTAFTPLREKDGEATHPDWERFDRCIDFIWVTKSIRIVDTGRCFDRPAEADKTLWPSDHVGVWADLELM